MPTFDGRNLLVCSKEILTSIEIHPRSDVWMMLPGCDDMFLLFLVCLEIKPQQQSTRNMTWPPTMTMSVETTAATVMAWPIIGNTAKEFRWWGALLQSVSSPVNTTTSSSIQKNYGMINEPWNMLHLLLIHTFNWQKAEESSLHHRTTAAWHPAWALAGFSEGKSAQKYPE